MDGQGSRPRLVKPKNARAKRALQKRAPRAVEVLKKALLLHGGTTSGVMKSVLADLSSLKKGESLKLSRANDTVRPFETGGEASLEFLARKADCSLFALASHSKKRPHTLVLGRFFDFRLLDMVELGVRAGVPPARQGSTESARTLAAAAPCRLRTTARCATSKATARAPRRAPSPAWYSAASCSKPTRCAPKPAPTRVRLSPAPRARRPCAPPRACC